MPVDIFARPILNSPYGRPGQHWELDAAGQSTGGQRVLSATPSFLRGSGYAEGFSF